jgi:multicomponent K+:H+ antiporter subunit D
MLLLLSVPGLPLLLAFPALRSRLPWPCHIALLPAFILLLVPVVVVTALPWLLFGTSFAIDGTSRWLLAMSVILWAVAATLLRGNTSQVPDNQLTTFVLLTMAGNLGVILAADLVGFFVFSTLMGYGFYGLLVTGGDERARRAGRVYLVFLVIADLILFEALLIAAVSTDELGFAVVGQAMAQSPLSTMYLVVVLLGFALKAGVWPLHFWLPPAFRSARPAVALVLWVGPVATALLGVMRWLPLGEVTAPRLGTLLQCLGAAAMLYAMLFLFMRVQRKQLSAYATILATGAFATGLGTSLAYPAIWEQYGSLVPFLVASVGGGLAIVILAVAWSERGQTDAADAGMSVGDRAPWFERWAGVLVRAGQRTGNETLPGLRAASLAKVNRLRQLRGWQGVFDTAERSMQRWAFAIVLFLLLLIIVAFVGASSWR